MKKYKKLLSCFMGILIALSMSFAVYSYDWIVGGDDPDQSNSGENTGSNDAGTLALMAESDGHELLFNETTGELVFKNESGMSVSSAFNRENYPGELTDLLESGLRRLVNIIILRVENGEEYTQSISNTDEGVALETKKQDKGFALVLTHEETGLSLTIDFILNGGRLQVTVGNDGITETKNGRLMSVELLPMFGSCRDDEDGYIVYPDGSGTLYRFKDHPGTSRYSVNKMIYSEVYTNLDDYIGGLETGQKALTMPVYGIKQGKQAILAVISGGAQDTSINLSPSGYIYNINRIAPVFHYRHSYYEKTVQGEEIVVFEENRVSEDFQITYSLLSEPQANYSGMAVRYREWMLENGLLNKAAVRPELSVDLLMTTKRSLLLFDQNRTVTSFDDAGNLLERLNESGISHVRLNLLGWQKGGYNRYPSHAPVSDAAGGKKGLKSLAEMAGKSNSSVYLADNFFEADAGVGGFSRRYDTAYSIAGKIITDSDSEKYLLDPKKGLDAFKTSLNKVLNLGIAGYRFDLLGELLYANKAKSKELSRRDFISTAREFLKQSKDRFGNAAVSGANAYTFSHADFIDDVPNESTREFLYDEDIPFVQMVLHGYIPYSSTMAGNLSDSLPETRLNWLEYGYVPSFILGQAESSALKDTDCEGLFISQIDDWSDQISALYKGFLNAYKRIKDLAITSHESDGKLRCVKYADGSALYINYGDEPRAFDGVEIPAMDFVLKEA